MRPPGTHPSGVMDWGVFAEMARDALGPELVRRGVVGWDGELGTDHVTITAGQDVDVHITLDGGFPVTARLAAPGGVWRCPAIGEEALVLAASGDWRTDGGPVAYLRHRLPPSNLSTSNAVLEVPDGGLLVGDGATKAAARTDDPIVPGTLTFVVGPVVDVLLLRSIPLVITYTPPGGPPQVTTITFTATILAQPAIVVTGAPLITLGGKVGDGSSKVQIE